MTRQGGIKGWEKNDNPDSSEYLTVWRSFTTDDEIRTEQMRRNYPITVRVWDKIDGEYAVESEDGRADREEVNASRRTFSSKEDAEEEAKRRLRRLNDHRIFATSISDDEIDSVLSMIKYDSRNQGQLGSRLREFGDKLIKGHKEQNKRF